MVVFQNRLWSARRTRCNIGRRFSQPTHRVISSLAVNTGETDNVYHPRRLQPAFSTFSKPYGFIFWWSDLSLRLSDSNYSFSLPLVLIPFTPFCMSETNANVPTFEVYWGSWRDALFLLLIAVWALSFRKQDKSRSPPFLASFLDLV